MHTERIDPCLSDLSAAMIARLDAEESVTTLERDYESWKLEQTAALVGTENPLTSKPHSHTSAKDGIKDTPDYHRWTVELDRARATQLRTRLAHELALEALRSVRVLAMIESGVTHV